MPTKSSTNRSRICRTVFVIFTLLILIFIQGTSSSTKMGEDNWQGRPTMLDKRYGHASAAVNGKIYAIGGWNDAEEYLNTVEEYDPISERWNSKTKMPTPRANHAAAVVNNKIYVIGGRNGTDIPALTTVEEYDPITNQWVLKTPMHIPRRSFATAVVDDRIYVFGGWNGSSVFATVEEYDPLSDSWQIRADMPTPRIGLAATTINGLIYTIGGSEEPNARFLEELDIMEEYDPQTNTWRGLPPMPTKRYLLTATSVGGRLYAIAGVRDYMLWENNTSYFIDESVPIVEEYDPESYTWYTRTNMTIGRWSHGTITLEGKIYTFGGINEYDWLSTMEVYSPPSYDTDNDGIEDTEEVGVYGTDPFSPDSDEDGLTDGSEVNIYGTNPMKSDKFADTDGDGLNNVDEVDTYGTDPKLSDINADTDEDNLENIEEVDRYHTDPTDSDTDNDGVNDGVEINAGTDPNNPNDVPSTSPGTLVISNEGEGVFVPGYTTIPVLLGISILLILQRSIKRNKNGG